MKIMAFDLSSVCIGVTTAEIKDNKVIKIKTAPIIPNKISPQDMGFLKSKKKLLLKNGSTVSSYCYEGEKSISMVEKKKRDVHVRTVSNDLILKQIAKSIGGLVEHIQPDIVLVEKNEIFRGILTSVLLAKVMGILVGVVSSKGIDLKEYNVQVVRKVFDMPKLYENLKMSMSPKELMLLPDVTKRAINMYLSDLYKVDMLTDDESDSLAVFHYWFTTHKNKGDFYGRI